VAQTHVTLPFDGDFDGLRATLAGWGFEVGERPNAPLFASGHGVTIHAYRTGKVLISGARAEYWAKEIAPEIRPHGGPGPGPRPGPGDADKYPLPAFVTTGVRAGVDEAGKGDFFGPLVTAGVVVDDALAGRLRDAGVRDSKQLRDEAILPLAEELRERLLPRGSFEVIRISAARYNTMHLKLGSVNRILGWAHARAIESLVSRRPECQAALSDKFGDESYIQRALMERGRQIQLAQVPRAEREVSVATASILARAEFVLQMRLMSAQRDFRFPLGATHVEDAARAFVAREGAAALAQVAKVHFRTTERVVDAAGMEAVTAAVRTAAPE
jgi:ribonuclease HIII